LFRLFLSFLSFFFFFFVGLHCDFPYILFLPFVVPKSPPPTQGVRSSFLLQLLFFVLSHSVGGLI